MKTLDKNDVIRIMREEWKRRIDGLVEAIGINMDVDVNSEKSIVVSPELKVMHKKSGIRYTVDSVGPRDVILRTPEGEKFIVDASELERSYDLD